MSDYYSQMDKYAWNAHVAFENNPKKIAEVAERHRIADEKEKESRQKALDERFIRIPEPSEIMTDCPVCGRYLAHPRSLCDGKAKFDYAPACAICGANVPTINGTEIKNIIVELIIYDEDEGY